MQYEDYVTALAAGLDSSTQLRRIADALDVLAGKVRRETLCEYERAVEERDQQQEAILLLHGSWPVLEAELARANRVVARLERDQPWLKSAQGSAVSESDDEE